MHIATIYNRKKLPTIERAAFLAEAWILFESPVLKFDSSVVKMKFMST
jgi:hypothetical protein